LLDQLDATIMIYW